MQKVRSKKDRVRNPSGWIYIDTSPVHSMKTSVIFSVDTRRSGRPLIDSSPSGIGELMRLMGDLNAMDMTKIIPVKPG